MGSLRIGDYEIVRRLGVGGFCEVYEGRECASGASVAIKIPLWGPSQQPFAPQLSSEARACQAVDHPGVIKVFKLGELNDGRPYLVMELLRGQSLSAWIESGVDRYADEVLDVIAGILDALSAVHAAGFVHRDLTPDNVFRTVEQGQTKVMLLDFGLAQVPGTPLAPGAPLIATPAYSAPEVLLFQPALVSSDLFSVGALAYELFTGAPPFGYEIDEVRMAQRLRLPRALADSITGPIAAFVERLLARDPRSRFGSAAAALAALDAVRAGMPMPQTLGLWSRLHASLLKRSPKPALGSDALLPVEVVAPPDLGRPDQPIAA